MQGDGYKAGGDGDGDGDARGLGGGQTGGEVACLFSVSGSGDWDCGICCMRFLLRCRVLVIER